VAPHAGPSADPFLDSVLDCLGLLPAASASALDVACGAGRHALWLARHGFRVTALDNSPENLAELRSLAQDAGLPVECRQVNLEAVDVDLGNEAHDLICVFYFLHRPLFPALLRALRPGGLLICRTFTTDQLRFQTGPRNPAHLLEPNELLRLAEGLRVLRYEETWTDRATASMVAQNAAQKPPQPTSAASPAR